MFVVVFFFIYFTCIFTVSQRGSKITMLKQKQPYKILHKDIIYLDYLVVWFFLKLCAVGYYCLIPLPLLLALPQKAQILPSPSIQHSEQSDHPFLILAHGKKRLKHVFSLPQNRYCIYEVLMTRRCQMETGCRASRNLPKNDGET